MKFCKNKEEELSGLQQYLVLTPYLYSTRQLSRTPARLPTQGIQTCSLTAGTELNAAFPEVHTRRVSVFEVV